MKNLLRTIQGELTGSLAKMASTTPRRVKFPEADNKIKVAIGMRRVGKTVCVYQKIRELLGKDVAPSQILYINFEDDRLLPISQTKLAELLEAFYSLYPENHDRQCYFFLDEIQNCENWPVVIRRFFDTKQLQLYLTGSSAKLLSKEIATSLRGRSLAVEVWPYSFDEYLTANERALPNALAPLTKKSEDQYKLLLEAFILQGGFPEVLTYSQAERQQTLQDYVDVVIMRDIIQRHHIKNISLIKYMIKSLLRNVATPFSINKFYNDLKSQGFAVGKDTLHDYLSYIEDAFLVFNIALHTESVRQAQVNPRKIYAVDSGLVNAYCLNHQKRLGNLFENLVYLELRRKQCTVEYYLTKQRFEVDFVVRTLSGNMKLLQCVWDLSDESVCQREYRALEIAQHETGLPGEVITVTSFLEKGIVLD